MKRWLAAAGMAGTAGFAVGQPIVRPVSTEPPGYLIIRIKLSESGSGAPAAGPGGLGAGLGGPGARGGMMQGGPGAPGGGPGGLGIGGLGGLGGMQQPGGRGGLGGLGGGTGSADGDGGGGFGGFGGQGLGGGANTPSAASERSVAVLVPYTRLIRQVIYRGKNASAERNPSLPTLLTDGTTTVLYQDGTTIQMKKDDSPTLEYLLKQEHTRWVAKLDNKPTLKFVDEALRRELPQLALTYADELVRMTTGPNKKPADADVENFVTAYGALKAKWDERLPADPTTQLWKSARLGAGVAVNDDAAHYTVLYYGDDAISPEALARKTKTLEDNFKSFYLWHALKGGKALPLPDRKLLVVIPKKGGDVSELRTRTDGLPVVSDAFYSQAHNLLVLSPERNDDVGKSFFETANAKYVRDGFDRNELLKGNHPPLKGGTLTPVDIALASTYALVEKVLKEEMDAAAITREGSRQLFAVSGVLPRHVVLPHWVENGAATLFHHPKGDGVVELPGKKLGLALGMQTGHGAPNYQLLREFQTLYPKAGENTDFKPEDVLRNTLTDKYFEAIATEIDPDNPVTPAPKPAGRPAGPGGFPGGPPGGGFPGGPGGRGGRGDPGNDAQAPPRGRGGMQQPGGAGGLQLPGGGPGGFGGLGGLGGNGQQNPNGAGILDPLAEKPPLTKEQLESKARATAWAVTYFLNQQQQMGKLHAFYAELNKMPRDLRLDKEVVLKTFCQVFGLLTEDKSAVDATAFKTFARDWMKYIRELQPSWREVTLATLGGNQPQGGQPGVGGFPGGLPGEGGPGGGGPGGGGSN